MSKTFKRILSQDALMERLVANLLSVSPDQLASVFNDILGFQGATGHKVEVVQDEDDDEPQFVMEVPEEELQMKYIVIGPFCWSKGSTFRQAWEGCKKEWPQSQGKPDKRRARFFHTPETIYVNGMGGLSGPKKHLDMILELDGEGHTKPKE